MAEKIRLSRTQLIYGLCLPLAVILGYVLARPLESPSLAVLVMVGSVLCVPLYMRWYHVVTIFSLNSTFYLGFMPGQLSLWVVCASLAFLILLLNRCVDPLRRLMFEPRVAWSLVGLAAMITLTAYLTGGIGMRALGSGSFGGKRYVFLWTSIIVYFVIASRRIPIRKAYLYIGLFFLPGVTGILGDLIYQLGGPFYKLFYIIPAGGVLYQAQTEQDMSGMGGVRIGGWLGTSQAVCLYMLARYGWRGLLDAFRPWRALILFLALCAGLFAGFRSFLILLGLIFLMAFLWEGLHRTRYLLWMLGLGLIVGVALTVFSTRLPLSVQRALSFLPVAVTPYVQDSADGSVAWRVGIWRNVLPDVHKHFFMGKGYALDPNELYMAEQNKVFKNPLAPSLSEAVGDYHSGPLSVLIPFGIWGALALVWFFIAVGRMLGENLRHGDPALRTINIAIIACFYGKLIFFLAAFGSISSDLMFFTSLAGFSVSLNGESKERVSKETAEKEFSSQYT